MMEASTEVVEASMEIAEAPMEVVEASVVVNVPRLPQKLVKASMTIIQACESSRNMWKLPWKLVRACGSFHGH